MSERRPPRVTVLSSIYSDAPFLREAMESVLIQTFTDFEYLILNDGAIDNSREIAASFTDSRIRIVDNPANLGLTKTLNRGLALAKGELIARFDSNDICFPERLARQVAFLDAHPDVAVVGAQAQVIDVNGRRIRRAEHRRPTSEPAMAWHCMLGAPLIHPATMYRRSVVWDELGGYDEAYTVGQDGELWLRIVGHHRLANLDQQLIGFRFDPRSLSSDMLRPARQGHRERWVGLARQGFTRFLGVTDVPEEWGTLWVDMHTPMNRIPPSESERFARLVEEWFVRFCALHPEATHDPEIAEHRAFLLQRAAEKTAITARLSSLRIFRRMAAIAPTAAARALPRLLLMWMAGDLPVRLFRRMKYGVTPMAGSSPGVRK